jgi:hypothetical protein
MAIDSILVPPSGKKYTRVIWVERPDRGGTITPLAGEAKDIYTIYFSGEQKENLWSIGKFNVGLSNALDLLYSARLIDAGEALELGLVNRVFPEETFMESTLAYAGMLASQVSPRSMGVIKKQVYEAQLQILEEASMRADEALLLSLQSEDFKEGVAHFI